MKVTFVAGVRLEKLGQGDVMSGQGLRKRL